MSEQDAERPVGDQGDQIVEQDAERPLQIPPELPLLPLRDTVLFPNSFMPLAVAREASVRLVEEANQSGRLIGVFTQREAATEEPMQEELYPVGTVTHIHKMFKLPDGSLRLSVQGVERVTLHRLVQPRPQLPGEQTHHPAQLRAQQQVPNEAQHRNIQTNYP